MTSEEPNEPLSSTLTDRVSTSFQKLLNQHGYSFQEAVTQRAADLRASGRSIWQLFGSEIPVICSGQPTHIDFVLQGQNNRSSRLGGFYLISECKRVNPAKGHWC